ncbi:hypothetical protein [Colwellia sp. RSH04]|uniref:hypothetical protein n=1 Tax=Colwellia sp. RSH04 TaxID=2305464 RepID=UPI000E57B849|nr:hypothetical protein [Colwellia sp. RSH04]RHW77707.1 hypothetical protein D1094_01845 [Colwellia sp. RSH04]
MNKKALAIDEQAILSQADLDDLLRINEFIESHDEHSLVEELKCAILDSGKLELTQWQSLRQQLKEIEALIPHIDLIIQLKREKP